MKNFLLFCLIIFFLGCGKEPYEKSINEGNQLFNENNSNNYQERLGKSIDKYREAYSFALAALEREYDAMYSLGVLLAQSGYFNKCIEIMSQAYNLNQNDPELYNYWAMCYANQAKISLDEDEQDKLANKAIEIYQKGLDIDSNNYRLNYGIAIVYGFILDNYEQALNYLMISFASNDKDVNTLFALGNINYQNSNIDKSIEYYQKILELTEPESSFYKKATENLEKIQK